MALRISVAAIFIYAGSMKLGDMEMVAGMLGSMGFPAAVFFAWVLALTELIGGIAVLLGLLTRWAAGLLAFTMVVAILTAHLSGTFQEAIPAIALLGSSLGLLGVGGGKWSVYGECPSKK